MLALALRGVMFGCVGVAGYVCIALCTMFELVTCSLIFGFRHRLGYLFVDDEDVVVLVSKIACTPALVLHCCQNVQPESAMLRGSIHFNAPSDNCYAM